MKGELDFETNFQMFFFTLRFTATSSHRQKGFIDHVYQYVNRHDDYFEVVYTMKGRCVKSAFEQIELNRNFKRVSQGNYLAIRIFLN